MTRKTTKLKITKRDYGDVTFIVPWKGKEIEVTWQAPAGCINGGFRFNFTEDEDEEQEFEQFLWDRVDISQSVTIKGA